MQLQKIVSKFSMNNDQLYELMQYSTSIGIDFASTPYSLEEAIFLVEKCNVPFLKIASMELNNIPYLVELAMLQVPLVLSTGMGTLVEIINAVEAIHSTVTMIWLYCIAPLFIPRPPILFGNNILGFRNEFPDIPVGFSDHTQGFEIPAAAVALGASLIEKHFTLDKSRIGMDNQIISGLQK